MKWPMGKQVNQPLKWGWKLNEPVDNDICLSDVFTSLNEFSANLGSSVSQLQFPNTFNFNIQS